MWSDCSAESHFDFAKLMDPFRAMEWQQIY